MTIEDIKNDDELTIEGGSEESSPPFPPEAKPLPPIPFQPSEPLVEYQFDENGNPIPIPIVKKPPPFPNIDSGALKKTLKKYHLSKTAFANFSIKQDFKDEVSKSYLKFIVKYVRSGEKRDTLFGDALGNADDNLYYIYKNLRLEGQAYAMTVENFWRLCFDAHVNLKHIQKYFVI